MDLRAVRLLLLAGGLRAGAWCGAFSLLMALSGWYKHPTLSNLMLLAIPIQWAALWWELRRTARAGLRFGGQVLAGLAIILIGTPIMLASSYVATRVLVPTYHTDQQALHRLLLQQQGLSDTAITAAMQAHQPPTPLQDAGDELRFRLVVGLVGAAGVASLVRSRSRPST